MITILAIGSKYYGSWAFNLAVSLKYHSDLPILLLCDKYATQHLKPSHLKVFDEIKQMQQKHSWVKGRLEPGRAKLHLYEYLDQDTIYIDADSICVRDPAPLFEQLKAYYYVCQRVGTVVKGDGANENMLWQTTEEIWDKFDLEVDQFPATNTSFQYIRICEETEKLYADAVDALDKGWEIKDLNLQWGRSKAQPDELYMNIALAKNKTDIGHHAPIHFTIKNKNVKTHLQIEKEHYFIGYWGDRGLNHRSVITLYDKLMKQYCLKVLKRHHEFKIHPLIKNKFLVTGVKNVQLQ